MIGFYGGQLHVIMNPPINKKIYCKGAVGDVHTN